MWVRVWRLITLLFVALSMSVAVAHLLELPAKLSFDEALWLTLLQNLYPPAFGTAGAVFEAGAVITSLVLTLLVRQRRPAFRWTLVGALAVVAAHAAFWLLVAPVNASLLPLEPSELPPSFDRLRAQWEYTHAARAVLQLLGLAALMYSVLVETPPNAPFTPEARGGAMPASKLKPMGLATGR